MAQLVRNKETGEYGLYSPDTGVQPISQDEAQVLQQSAAGNIARSVGGALTDAAGSFIEFTLPTILNADGTRRPNIGTRIQEWNDPQQAARRKMRPGQEFAGQALALGAELAVPGGVASKGRRAADAAATPASRGAARGAEMAQQAIEVNRARMPSLAQEGADMAGNAVQRAPTKSLSAAETTVHRGPGKSDFLSPVEASNMGMRLTPAQHSYLKAWDDGSMEGIKAGENALAREDYIRQTSLVGDTNLGDVWRKDFDQSEFFTRNILDELGLHDVERLTRNEAFAARSGIQDIYNDILDSGKNPIATKFADMDGAQIDVVNQVRNIVSDLEQVPASVNKAVKDIEEAARRGKDGAFDMDKFRQTQTEINEAVERAFSSGKYDTGMTLASIKTQLDEALAASLDTVDQNRLALANRRWKIQKVLQRTVGTTSKTDAGIVNPNSFINNYRQMTPSYKRNTRELDDFERMLRTVETLGASRAHTGSTLIRGFVPVSKGIAATAVTGAVGGAVAAGLGGF